MRPTAARRARRIACSAGAGRLRELEPLRKRRENVRQAHEPAIVEPLAATATGTRSQRSSIIVGHVQLNRDLLAGVARDLQTFGRELQPGSARRREIVVYR